MEIKIKLTEAEVSTITYIRVHMADGLTEEQLAKVLFLSGLKEVNAGGFVGAYIGEALADVAGIEIAERLVK